MRNIIKFGTLFIVSALLMVACNTDQYGLGTLPTSDQLSITATPTAKANILKIVNSSTVKGIAVWDLGNGTKTKGDTVMGTYPLKGSYTISMTLYTSGGATSVTKTISIANDDMSLLNTPMYTALTGGLDSINGKTWVFDQYNAGHFGVGPFDAATPIWWQCPADGKDGSSLYSQKFTFKQIGTSLIWTNDGRVYTNQAGVTKLATLGYTDAVANAAVGDFDVTYAPKSSYTYTLNEAAMTLTLSDGAFMGHYAGTSTYQILVLNDNEMYLKCVSTVEPGNGWWYRFVPVAKNVKPVVPVKAIPLSEDFEGATPKVPFTFESMGALSSLSYSNPAPLPINTSSKVMLYQKGSEFYANTYFVASGYKFDLSQQNKITVKVFIPSYNDYVTSYPVAGSWITNSQLLPQLSVKLQNSDLGGNAWSTQTEIIKANLDKDKWLSLTFDFSGVATRTDYDKIVIQFGGEGHAGPGIFFLDDFSFSK